MNSRDRFRETMRYGTPDRVPYFEEGIRDDVLRAPGANPNLKRGFATIAGRRFIPTSNPCPVSSSGLPPARTSTGCAGD